jgi:hypothetical protein
VLTKTGFGVDRKIAKYEMESVATWLGGLVLGEALLSSNLKTTRERFRE